MPVVLVDARNLHDRLKKVHPEITQSPTFELEEFEQALETICFNYGLELDGIDVQDGEDKPKVRVEIPANRYDLLCEHGIAAAFAQFIAPLARPLPKYRHSRPAQTTLTIHQSTYPNRPYAGAAIFRNVKFDAQSFAAFIELQDKLHQNLARKRTLVAMGTHNLDVIEPPFTYEHVPRSGGFRFAPLGFTTEVDGNGMVEALAESHVRAYLPIITQHENFPVIFDAKRRVCSVPPIINSELSKMDAQTTNVFVELTGTDDTKLEIILDQLTAFLGELMNDPWTVEPVRCIYADGHPGLVNRRTREHIKEICTPTLNLESFKLDVEYCRRICGVPDLEAKAIPALLLKMGLRAEMDPKDANIVHVEIPITRRDVFAPCDLVEEVAIAYGVNNIRYDAAPATYFNEHQNILERARRCLCAAGWKECLTFGLISEADAYANLGRKCGPTQIQEIYPLVHEPIRVSEPKTREFEIVRPTLIPGLLHTLSSNQASNLPIEIFETGEVVLANNRADNRSTQGSRIAAIIAHAHGACLERIHGLLDHVLSEFNLEAEYALTPAAFSHHKYYLEEYSDNLFLPKRAVKVMVYAPGDKANAKCLGIMGVVHPNTLKAFNIPWVCSLFEISLDPLDDWLDVISKAAP